LKLDINKNLHTAFFLMVAATSFEVVADNNHYRWQDSSGKTVYSDEPPPNSEKYDIIDAPVSPNPAASAPRGNVSQETAPSVSNGANVADSESKEDDSKKNSELCQSAKMKLVALQANRQLTVRNDKGEAKELSPEEREISKQHAQEQIDTYCD